MANKYFFVHNGLTVGNLSVDASTGNLITTSTTSSNSTSTGALQVAGGVGVADSVYVGNKVGFVGTNSASVSYTYYNAATASVDTVFG